MLLHAHRRCLTALFAMGVALALLFAVSLAAQAAASLSAARDQFAQADRALRRGDDALYAQIKPQLVEYPLYPYLLYLELSRNWSRTDTGRVRDFLTIYGDTPLATRLRKGWLQHLAKTGRWSDLLRDYRPELGVELACWQRQALLATGQSDAALDGIEQIWLSPASLPSSCDPLFEIWRSKGGLTRERVWARFGLAMDAGELRLARYLKRRLPPPDQRLADLWMDVDTNPRLVIEAGRFDAADSRTPEILMHGLRRWSRADSVTAAEALDTLKKSHSLPDDDVAQLEYTLALFLASRGHPSALDRLTAVSPERVDAAVREWRVRTVLQQHDWQATLKWLDALSPAEVETAQWQYWRARALEATGREDQARDIYHRIAARRDYHGFLAADRLGLAYQINDASVQVSATELDTLLGNHAGLVRARELYYLGRQWEARVEWSQVIRDLDTEQLKRAAKLAQSWGWHDQAIVTLARAGYWDDLSLRFPTPYQDRVLASARSEGIDPAWVFAVMRQESIFRSDAKSPAGALGLMQIMPATGRRIAKDLQLSLPNNYVLLKPDTNIRYGTRYLRHTLDRLQNNPVLATAAYNAGPHRVRQWLPEHGRLDADLWAETVPFFETRKYIKNVMEYTTVYEQLLGKSTGTMLARMGRIQAGAGE